MERLPDGRIRISGTFSVDDFNEQFDRALPVDDYHTMAGFVFGLLGRAPEPGDEVSHDGTQFTVVDVEGTRIERLEVEFTVVEAASDETERLTVSRALRRGRCARRAAPGSRAT